MYRIIISNNEWLFIILLYFFDKDANKNYMYKFDKIYIALKKIIRNYRYNENSSFI